MDANKIVDTFGIIRSIHEIVENTTKAGTKFTKRSVTIEDKNKDTIDLVFWGQRAVNFEVAVNTIITVKGAKINEYQNVQYLSVLSDTVTIFNDTNNAEILRYTSILIYRH
ncbi:replication protein A 70 kDa DNA-binding subunit-like [Leptopilina heterotoma]|uniref:replication protein A 70 kDa DNA-binding subunit-like n=1 Tax=Leptopilina heterotoma TaxID=63436 RepID=UPI001CA7F4F9|nr:replication protein A 70 kDa DNA-binding subunit-like [Leptopilina heterotoma]